MDTEQRQKAAIRLITHILGKAGHIQATDGMIIKLTAQIYVECQRLQAYCMRNGTTYEVRTREGELITKHRPEHQQLTEARGKLLQMLKELGATPNARKRIETEVDESDELAELIAGL